MEGIRAARGGTVYAAKARCEALDSEMARDTLKHSRHPALFLRLLREPLPSPSAHTDPESRRVDGDSLGVVALA